MNDNLESMTVEALRLELETLKRQEKQAQKSQESSLAPKQKAELHVWLQQIRTRRVQIEFRLWQVESELG